MTANKSSLQLLRELIACKSVTPQQAGALDLLQGKLAAAGFSVERMPSGEVDNLWAQYGDTPRLLFAGHVDVVPPGDLSKWQTDPFVAEERDGFIHGRGAVDMKSGVAAMTVAALRAAEEQCAEGLALLFTSDEEGDATEGTAHVVRELQKRKVQIDRCIVGEPTCENNFGDYIKTGRRGSLSADITITGKQAHAAYPHRGENPVPPLMCALIEAGKNFNSESSKHAGGQFPPTTFQIVKLQSGVAENVIPPQARATINFRYAPDDAPAQLQKTIEETLQKHAPQKWQCQWRHGAVPFVTDKNAPLITELKKIITAVASPPSPPQTSTGGGSSDGRFLREICAELAEFGPINAGIHEVNEKVQAAHIPQLTEIYFRLARHFLA